MLHVSSIYFIKDKTPRSPLLLQSPKTVLVSAHETGFVWLNHHQECWFSTVGGLNQLAIQVYPDCWRRPGFESQQRLHVLSLFQDTSTCEFQRRNPNIQLF